MKKIDANIDKILNNNDIQKLLNSFTIALELGAVFYNKDGKNPIKPDNYKEINSFCHLVQSTEIGQNRCVECMLMAGLQSVDLGETYISICHAGLVEFYAPLMFKDIFLGFIACGPVLMWDWDEMAIEELIKKTKDLSISSEKLLVASNKIKVYSSKNVSAAADMLFMMVNYLASSGMLSLQNKRELSRQQQEIADLIFKRKRAEEAISVLELRSSIWNYPINKEKELLGKVRLGDRQGAKEILNELLGDVFFKNSGNLNVIKARVMELIVVITRAAVESGASLESMLGLNFEQISQLSKITDFVDLCNWLVKRLDSIMDTVYELRNIKNTSILSTVMTYIRSNYTTNITLDDVSGHVFLSSYYLSHLFKDELGITFVEYLTRVRVEAAKTLLMENGLPIANIAHAVGYEDASYFGKVFKKNAGVTPAKYRKGIWS